MRSGEWEVETMQTWPKRLTPEKMILCVADAPHVGIWREEAEACDNQEIFNTPLQVDEFRQSEALAHAGLVGARDQDLKKTRVPQGAWYERCLVRRTRRTSSQTHDQHHDFMQSASSVPT